MALCRGHMECGLGHLTPVPPERLLYNSRSNWRENVLFTFAMFELVISFGLAAWRAERGRSGMAGK